MRNVISQVIDTDGLLVFRNLDDVEGHGIEAEIAATFPNGFKGRLSYAYQESGYENSDEIWSNSPRHLAKVNISFPLLNDDLFLSLEEQYTHRLKTLSERGAGSYYLTNATLLWCLPDGRTELSGSVYNLFDRRYALPGSKEHEQDSIEQDGISLRATLNYRF